MLRLNVLAKPAKGLLLSISVSALLSLAACGGGGGGSDPAASSNQATFSDETVVSGSSASDSGPVEFLETLQAASTAVPAIEYKPQNKAEAARFLGQATFGPNDTEINNLMLLGYIPWLKQQISRPPTYSYRGYVESRHNLLKNSGGASPNDINHIFWASALNGSDQLRQRVALALSEIFVISTADGCGANNIPGAASYLEMLGKKAFGSYRDLLESVALHPVMGCYLSHLKNQREDLVTGRVPDENFAREIMQLFSIGLYELNRDGTRKLNSAGQPIETYSADDVAGLAKVFTGWSWDCPGYPKDVYDNCFIWGSRHGDGSTYSDRWSRPMRSYAKFHSPSAKNFLGVVIPPQAQPNPEASLKIALDRLASHPNVGPFIGKLMIQRLVTSNPSPAYVRRVTDAFNNSGGSLQSMVAAVLMDTEARNGPGVYGRNYGKVREPLLRLSALLRAYGAQSTTGYYIISTMSDATALNQTTLQAPSVFNFFRPSYVPPNSEVAKAGLVSPELQLVHETTSASYINLMRSTITWGIGRAGYDNRGAAPDVLMEFHRNSTTNRFILMAANPASLVDDINERLLYGKMPAALKNEIVEAVSSIDYRYAKAPTAKQTSDTYRDRLYAALLLTVASPEFQVQK